MIDINQPANSICRSRGFRIFALLSVLLLVLLWVLKSQSPGSPGRYQITEIPLLGEGIFLHALNDSGQAVGYVHCQPQYRAIIWDAKNGTKALATPDGYSSIAVDINNSGEICGDLRDPNRVRHACFWDSEGRIHHIGTLGGRTSMAGGLNDHGQVVGLSSTSRKKRHAFLWTKEQGIMDLDTRDTMDSNADDINNKGQIAGQLWTSSDRSHAFIWQKDTGMVDIHDKLEGVESMPLGINDSGQIIGTYLKADDTWRAFVLDDNGRFRDLGISSKDGFGCHPAAITDQGQAIAMMHKPRARRFFFINQREHNLSFLFDDRLRMLYLHKALPFKTDKFIAHDINNKGQIIVRARKDKSTKWYLMTPHVQGN